MVSIVSFLVREFLLKLRDTTTDSELVDFEDVCEALAYPFSWCVNMERRIGRDKMQLECGACDAPEKLA